MTAPVAMNHCCLGRMNSHGVRYEGGGRGAKYLEKEYVVQLSRIVAELHPAYGLKRHSDMYR